jgi:hypothetical protein
MSEDNKTISNLKILYPNSVTKMRKKDFDRLRNLVWSEEDRRSVGNPQLDNLPVHLRFLEYVISTRGDRRFLAQGGIIIPGSSVVHLYYPTGQMMVGRKGWPHPVNASGHFTNGAIYRAEDRRCSVTGINKYCMIVATPKIVFYNSRIPNWGASVGSLDIHWEVGANDGGTCLVAFNDDHDSDNSGALTMRIRIIQARDFADMYAHLAVENAEDEEMYIEGGGNGVGI